MVPTQINSWITISVFETPYCDNNMNFQPFGRVNGSEQFAVRVMKWAGLLNFTRMYVMALRNTDCHLPNEYAYWTNGMHRSRHKFGLLSPRFIFAMIVL